MGCVMKAIRFDRYGSPDVLELRDVEVPAVGDDELLVRVRAASVNPLDWHFMRGMPYLVRLMAGLSQPKASNREAWRRHGRVSRGRGQERDQLQAGR
jgi:NADPH:quinone reductase-like Zn-dependent oxidoreductase